MAQSCGNGFLQLSSGPARLGDSWTVTIQGAPSAPALVGVDFSAGPIALPAGTVCLGPSAQLATAWLDAAGVGSASWNLPANPAIAGLTLYAQGAAIDAAAPFALALSNGVSRTVREPRIIAIDHGSSNPFAPPVPGQLFTFDALSGASLWSTTLAAEVTVVAHSAVHDITLCAVTGVGTVGLDGTTGAVLFTAPGDCRDLALSPDESVALVVTPTEARVLSLPSGGVSLAIPHGLSIGLFNFQAGTYVKCVPGTQFACLVGGVTVRLFDYIGGVMLPAPAGVTIQGGILDWEVAPGRVVVADRGPGVGSLATPRFHTIDVQSNAAFPGSPAAPGLSTYDVDVAFGSTPSGQGLLALYWNNGAVLEITAGGAVGAIGSFGTGAAGQLAASAGGGDWLAVHSDALNGVVDLIRVDPATLAVTSVTPLASSIVGGIEVLDSSLVRRAFYSVYGDVFVMTTDPVGAPTLFATVPSASGLALVDG